MYYCRIIYHAEYAYRMIKLALELDRDIEPEVAPPTLTEKHRRNAEPEEAIEKYKTGFRKTM